VLRREQRLFPPVNKGDDVITKCSQPGLSMNCFHRMRRWGEILDHSFLGMQIHERRHLGGPHAWLGSALEISWNGRNVVVS
jgi:hypothetical protein